MTDAAVVCVSLYDVIRGTVVIVTDCRRQTAAPSNATEDWRPGRRSTADRSEEPVPGGGTWPTQDGQDAGRDEHGDAESQHRPRWEVHDTISAVTTTRWRTRPR